MKSPGQGKMIEFGLWIGVAVLVGVLALRTRIARSEFIGAQATISDLQRNLVQVGTRAEALARQLRELPIDDRFVEALREAGIDLRPGTSPTIVYWTSPSCSACLLNVPFLDSLGALHVGKVVAVSTATDRELRDAYGGLLDHVQQVSVGGDVARLVFPHGITPVTISVERGRRGVIAVGTLSERERTELGSAIGRKGGSGAPERTMSQ